ncbi:hypothetical protein [Flavisolibacter ginsenosidimutans]|uniref:PorT family protein n=1 Tax=Flavisolibacter ginsenosidimutans TaxID=661481 RepID=A0A5B8UMQ4_9BACT|nr:hypothetical protein [Flavisolibacter ginsenosidimutans]QEC57350.1 hypothetical protein FSB75_16060 [Flavisolibacter ginsenosidimutans]
MKQRQLLFALAFASVYFSSCITVAPVHGTYEKAGTLGKGGAELAGHYTHYSAGDGGASQAVNNNIGFRAGLGVADNVDLKVRYEKLIPVEKPENGSFNASYFSVIPKFGIHPGKLAVFVPLSLYHFSASENGGVATSSNSYSIAPHVIGTFTAKSNQVDFSPSANVEYIINKGQGSENDFLMGFNIGAGFSSDLRKWAIRPELGYLFKPGESGHVWNVGVGLQVLLTSKHKK